MFSAFRRKVSSKATEVEDVTLKIVPEKRREKARSVRHHYSFLKAFQAKLFRPRIHVETVVIRPCRAEGSN